jgi:hypothetical protein
MSNIIRCDKCKEELPKKVAEKKTLLRKVKGTAVEYYWSFLLQERVKSEREYSFHLCQSCLDKLKMWLDIN